MQNNAEIDDYAQIKAVLLLFAFSLLNLSKYTHLDVNRYNKP